MKNEFLSFLMLVFLSSCIDVTQGEYISETATTEKYIFVSQNDSGTSYRMVFNSNDCVTATKIIGNRSSYLFHELSFTISNNQGKISSPTSVFFTFTIENQKMHLTVTDAGSKYGYSLPEEWTIL